MIGWTRTACCRRGCPRCPAGRCGIPARRVCRPGRRQHPRGLPVRSSRRAEGQHGWRGLGGGNHLCSCALSLGVRIVQPPRSPTAGRAVLAVVHSRPRRDGTGGKADRSWAVTSRLGSRGRGSAAQVAPSCLHLQNGIVIAPTHLRGARFSCERSRQLT